jgi:hypothetical protein
VLTPIEYDTDALARPQLGGAPSQFDDDANNQRRKGWLAGLLLRRGVSQPPLPSFYHRLLALPRRARRRLGRKFAAALVGAALLFASVQIPAAHAATITVDGTKCTLADAIRAANTDSIVGRCRAGSGADVLVLRKNVTLTAAVGTYYNSPTCLPLVTSQITIQGNNHTIRRDPADPDKFRLLAVSATGDLTINNTTLSGGYIAFSGGGAIRSQGDLTINNSTLSGNTGGIGGAIYSQIGTLAIKDSTLSGNTAAGDGGAISTNNEATTIHNSLISGNVADYGGGVSQWDGGPLTITNSVIANNNSGGFRGGGGLFLQGSGATIIDSTIDGNHAGRGGGVLTYTGVTILNSSIVNNDGSEGLAIFGQPSFITNSTISGNLGDGVFVAINQDLTITNSTITNNGDDGVYSYYGDLTLQRSLISGNNGYEVFHDIYCYDYCGDGSINVDAFNVFGHSGDAGVATFTPGPTDIVPAEPLSAILAGLADNGGPTPTHAFVPGSPAIDVAPSADCAAPPIFGLDQRGFPRNVDGDGVPSANECDVGAFELQPAD